MQSSLACAPAPPFTSVLELDDEQFHRWAELVRVRTGMRIPPERRSFLATGIGLRMREIGCECPEEYFARLTSGRGSPAEWSTLVDRLTVHETRFFRHPQSMALVTEQVHARTAACGQNTVRFEAWSAGCATGEEAYTLAMVIDQALEGHRRAGRGAYFGVIGTDISQPALRTARQGLYPAGRLKSVPPPLLDAYFESAGEGHARVRHRLRRRVCFARGNILDAARAPFGPVDLVYCQNLLIYFDRARRTEIVDAMVMHLRPGGLLILGSGEVVGWNDSRMEKVPSGHTCAYRRVR